jgi:hypothetical protein
MFRNTDKKGILLSRTVKSAIYKTRVWDMEKMRSRLKVEHCGTAACFKEFSPVAVHATHRKHDAHQIRAG